MKEIMSSPSCVTLICISKAIVLPFQPKFYSAVKPSWKFEYWKNKPSLAHMHVVEHAEEEGVREKGVLNPHVDSSMYALPHT